MQIVFFNAKGGVGKTTSSLIVAATLKEVGHNTTIDDRDPQQSATNLVGNMGLIIGQNGNIVITDTAPRLDHEPTLEAIQAADIAILVSSPSPADLSTTMKTAHIVQEVRKDKPTSILFNQLVSGTTLTRELDEISKLLPYRPLKNSLSRRQGYQKATLLGWKALTPESREEAFKVTTEILGLKI